MSEIKILSAELAGRIAAGEVIERPASVVKELVENSIDAGATRIRVLTEKGGQRLIQVIDNGKGMDRQDALMCLEAHATSKITETGDVGQISTLGFRGEAMPSISSVSRFHMQTRPHDPELPGTDIIVQNGMIEDVRDSGCAPGTNIRVEFLFGNLPARRKFLKGPNTEDAHIEETMFMLALSRPEIAFELMMNGRRAMQVTAVNDLAARTMMLLGKDTFAEMLPVEYTEDGIHVFGFISKPGFTRNSRRDQRVVINGRVASADTIYFAIREAYDTLILKGRYPGTVLYITLDPERVDVNVHPAKREVRFRNPNIVANIVRTALQQALRSMPGGGELRNVSTGTFAAPFSGIQPVGSSFQPAEFSAPLMQPGLSLNLPPPDSPAPGRTVLPQNRPQDDCPVWLQNPSLGIISHPSGNGVMPSEDSSAKPEMAGMEAFMQPVPSGKKSEESAASAPLQGECNARISVPPPPVSSVRTDGGETDVVRSSLSDGSGKAPLQLMRLKGRFGKKYLLAESQTGLVVIDIHAALQRIFFERMLKNMQAEKILQQTLLIPVSLNLGAEESRVMRSELENFQKIGFTIEHFGGNSYIVAAVPAQIPDQDIGRTIRDILEDLRSNRSITKQNTLHLVQTAARFAVRLKEDYSVPEQEQIVRDLVRCDMPYVCPNGQATMIHFTFSELERRFKN